MANAATLAKWFGVTARHISRLAETGVLERSARNTYLLDQAVPALFEALGSGGEVGTKLQEAKLRKLDADAAMAEHKLQVERGQYAPIHEFAMAQAAQAAAIRQNVFYNMPQVAWLALSGEKDETRWKTILKEKIRQALQQAADADLNEYLDQPEANEDE
ncbi:hypothetical protein CFB45_12305 [Burkholderia sp. HI2500]|nr:hypothetical protein CFB45_12305 [Burkholderia sp. HI2500]